MPFIQNLEFIRNDVNAKNTSGSFKNDIRENNRYTNGSYKFPSDIGAEDKAHYIRININAQVNTQFHKRFNETPPTIHRNMRDLNEMAGGSTNLINNTVTTHGGTAVSYVADLTKDVAKYIPNGFFPTSVGDFTDGLIGGVKAFGGGISGLKSDTFLRTIKRVQDNIILYMPDKITYNNAQNYGEISLGGTVASLAGISALLSSTSDPKNMATFGAFAAGEVSRLAKAKKELGVLATAVTQVVKNPMLEVMYQGVSLRKFNFSFSFWPRSEQEALEIQKIIELLRFHQAPEIKSNTGGFFLVPPSEFDIAFEYNGKVNPNIDKISTCVLTNISVDYTPRGFHAFESVGSIDTPELGKTGMPVGINLSLSFMETQIITKEYYRSR